MHQIFLEKNKDYFINWNFDGEMFIMQHKEDEWIDALNIMDKEDNSQLNFVEIGKLCWYKLDHSIIFYPSWCF